MNQTDFDIQRKIGEIGERLVSNVLQQRGCFVIASYEFSGKNDDKAPKMRSLLERLVIPDLDIARNGKRYWIEVKTYTRSAYNRRHRCDVHGIKRKHFDHYLRVQTETGCRVGLIILEKETGIALFAWIDKLIPLACQCPACRDSRPDICIGAIEDGVYFDRTTFRTVWSFEKQDLEYRRQTKARRGRLIVD